MDTSPIPTIIAIIGVSVPVILLAAKIVSDRVSVLIKDKEQDTRLEGHDKEIKEIKDVQKDHHARLNSLRSNAELTDWERKERERKDRDDRQG